MERQEFYDSDQYKALYKILGMLMDEHGIAKGATPNASPASRHMVMASPAMK